jgi:ethanolamine utilization microcompartment shell protein EutL
MLTKGVKPQVNTILGGNKMAKIKKIQPAVAALERRKRVAAYARVSKDTERLLHSVSAQVSYYNKLIQGNPEW